MKIRSILGALVIASFAVYAGVGREHDPGGHQEASG